MTEVEDLKWKIRHLEAEIDDLLEYKQAIQLITYGKTQ